MVKVYISGWMTVAFCFVLYSSRHRLGTIRNNNLVRMETRFPLIPDYALRPKKSQSKQVAGTKTLSPL